MFIELAPEIENRLNSWSISTHEPPQKFIDKTLSEALEDWEDYMDAVRICALVDSGEMKTYSLEEVERELDGMDD
ncbi:MAG: hypothetical protein IJS40_03310 [Synergistaceae bacterium]|nr:hypothetical protein [Synergistaceae bacterium]